MDPQENVENVEAVETTADAVTTDAVATPAVEDELGTPFKLSEVPEEYREDVERYVKQTHGAFTRKTQELAEFRREAESALEFQRRLESDETRDEALREVLAQYGYEIDEEASTEEVEAAVEAVTDHQAPHSDPDVLARLQALEAQRAQEEAERAAEARSEYVSEVEDRIAEGVSGLAKSLGQDELSREQTDTLLAIVRQLPPIEGRWPDVEGAVARYEALRAAEIQAYVNSKRVTPVHTEGSSPGAPKADLSNDKARLAAANAIAGRHL